MDKLKNYIEGRTAEDIMNDYGEQRDEYETLLVVSEGEVIRFRQLVSHHFCRSLFHK